MAIATKFPLGFTFLDWKLKTGIGQACICILFENLTLSP